MCILAYMPFKCAFALFLLLAVSPLNGAQPAREKTIYATLPAEEHVFWKTVEKGIEKAAKDHGYQAMVRSGHYDLQYQEDPMTEVSFVNFLIRQGARTIILAPSQTSKRDVPVPPAQYVFAGRGADKFTLPYKGKALVAINSFKAGYKGAMALKGKLPRGSKVGAFNIDRGIETIDERIAGFFAGARSLGFEVVFEEPIGHGIREAQARAKVLLEKHPEVQAVFAPNERTAYSGAKAIAELPKEKRPLLVGFDYRDEFAGFLRQGVMLAAVVQDPFMIGYKCAETVIRLEAGKKVEANTEIDTFVIDRGNIDSPSVRERIKYYRE